MTLSLFPTLLSWSMLAPFLIRITLGVVFIWWASVSLKDFSASPRRKIIAILELVSGILLIIGLWVQGAALYAAIHIAIRLVGKIKEKKFLTDGVNYYLILFILSLTLLVTGAGLFALDYPL